MSIDSPAARFTSRRNPAKVHTLTWRVDELTLERLAAVGKTHKLNMSDTLRLLVEDSLLLWEGSQEK